MIWLIIIVRVLNYYHVMHLYRCKKKICTTQNLRSTAHGSPKPAFIMRRGPFWSAWYFQMRSPIPPSSTLWWKEQTITAREQRVWVVGGQMGKWVDWPENGDGENRGHEMRYGYTGSKIGQKIYSGFMQWREWRYDLKLGNKTRWANVNL